MAITNAILLSEAWNGMYTLISQDFKHKTSKKAFTEFEDWIC